MVLLLITLCYSVDDTGPSIAFRYRISQKSALTGMNSTVSLPFSTKMSYCGHDKGQSIALRYCRPPIFSLAGANSAVSLPYSTIMSIEGTIRVRVLLALPQTAYICFGGHE
ncbi:hypothetical protein [Neobacillus niacini]|uniref:hypothetical protein n=1 Tax=Neobacillus niacini TaxID=86668 RepID=UPI001471EE82|nr:hypothetical protein [Neobacillus niacini]